LIFSVYPGFAAKIETKKVPVLNDLIDNLQSIYISRGGTETQRTENLNEIIKRQHQVENDPRFPPICVYAEGTQTNGTHLLTFKKGAFIGLNTV
jgi:lysophosphatidylcholine acyltransferase/lyso-PAF acetyltransferase